MLFVTSPTNIFWTENNNKKKNTQTWLVDSEVVGCGDVLTMQFKMSN